MWNRKLKTIKHLVIGTALIGLLSNCNFLDSDNSDTNGASLGRVPFTALALTQSTADCTGFKEYVTSSLVTRHTNIPKYPYYNCRYPQPSRGGVEGAPAAGDAVSTVDGSPSAGGGTGAAAPTGPDGVSGTNNQEVGVNEGDMVKVDSVTGTMFIGHGSHLIIADAFPPLNMTKSREIDLKAEVVDLYYDETNKRVVVMTRFQQPVYILEASPPLVGGDAIAVDFAPPFPYPQNPETMVLFFDVTSPAEPVLIDQLAIQGHYLTSRRIDSRLHMVTRFDNYRDDLWSNGEFVQLKNQFDQAVSDVACADPDNYDPAVAENDPTVIAAKNSLTAMIKTYVSGLDINTFLPTAQRGNTANLTPVDGFLQCDNVYFPEVKSDLSLQVVTSMDTNGGNTQAAAIVNNSWLTYVSQNNLYMAERSGYWWWQDAATRDQTAIHKFSISSGRPQYISTGSVDGYAQNSFNFSEYNGVLRVATTETDYSQASDDPNSPIRWTPILKNHLSVLRDNNAGKMTVVGEVRDLAIGETIQSVRFLGNRGFIVTYRNIDPLFTFDLSNPEKPTLLGELKIPGFSSYMHPYDDNHLLTVGRDGNAAGTGLGNNFQIQLIDVTDLSNPIVLDEYAPDLPQGYSWTTSQYDHHAFTYYAPEKLLAVPIQVSSWGPLAESFTGVMAFRIDLNVAPGENIKELGRVDHSDLAKQFYCADNVLNANYSYICTDSNYIGWAAPRRSVVMTSNSETYLYTLSDVGMKAIEVNDFKTTLGSMLFPPQYYPWPMIDTISGGGSTGVVSGGGVVSSDPVTATPAP